MRFWATDGEMLQCLGHNLEPHRVARAIYFFRWSHSCCGCFPAGATGQHHDNSM
jgi:hypothetical protein